jgi:hypothetical protein
VWRSVWNPTPVKPARPAAGNQDAAAKAALVGRAAVAAAEHEGVVRGIARALSTQRRGELRCQRDEARAVA